MNLELARSNADLDDFAYIASHDLKEPLRGIANYSQFLAEDYGDKLDDQGKRQLQTLRDLCNRMEDLIDALLHFSRVGRSELAVRPTNLDELLADVLKLMHVTMAEQRVEVHAEPLPTIKCDSVRVGELLRNLISNAIKYNDKPEKYVEIGCLRANELSEPPKSETQKNGGPYVFYVRDNGIGIREKHLESVFRIFKRLHSRDKFGGGTGAGLTFAKQIAERHGGRIWAESSVGVGTTFFFTLHSEKING